MSDKGEYGCDVGFEAGYQCGKDEAKQRIAELEAEVERLARQVPEGCVVVPREPNDKWIERVIRFYQPHLDRNCLAWRKNEEYVRYWIKAMIAAGEVKPT